MKVYTDYLKVFQGGSSQSRANFEDSLLEMHVLLFRFLARAIHTYKKKTFPRAMDAFWRSEEIQSFESECDKAGRRAEFEANSCERTFEFERFQQLIKALDSLVGIGNSLNKLQEEVGLAKLRIAEGATFDSHQEEVCARCHPETRIELCRQIKKWALNPQGECIFWLNGMAGTGKSTISRTIAQHFAENGQLGASFFFKRGEGERGNASRFFTTITAQLAYRVPDLIPYVQEAIDTKPEIFDKSLEAQFEALILAPLSKTGQASEPNPLSIVIDALDECDQEEHVKTILHLLARMRDLPIVHIRIFLTSRPEFAIRVGFEKLSAEAYQEVVLQDLPIEHDIFVFLRDELAMIRDEHNSTRSRALLPLDWPGHNTIQNLTQIAVPLFIFAATLCRFVADHRRNPQKQLDIVLKHQGEGQASKLCKTYFPVLDQLVADLTNSRERTTMMTEFREVVGSIVILASPLSVDSLASLLQIQICSAESLDF